MKKKLLLLFGLSLFWSYTFAQTNTFYRTYNLGGMQGGLATLGMPDGGFVGTGQHEGNGSHGDCDIYAYRVDPCGEILWMKLIGTAGMEGAKHISLKANGNLLLTGIFNTNGFLLELDPSGNVVWLRIINISGYTYASAEAPNGDIYVTSEAPNGYHLTKCDPTGNVIWSRQVTNAGIKPLSLFCSNNAVFVGSTYTIPGNDFSITKFDHSGNLDFSYSYGGSGFSELDISYYGHKSIFNSIDNSILVANQTSSWGSEDILLAKINATTGQPIWSKIYGGPNSEQPRDIVETDAGYAMIGSTNSFPVSTSSTISDPMNQRDILLVHLDQNGDLLWSKTYGAGGRDKGIGLKYNPGEGFLISAYTNSTRFGVTDLNSYDPLFLKTDINGFISCQTHSPTLSQQSITLTQVVTSTISNTSAILTPVAPNVVDYIPNDYFICLQCFTTPIIQPEDTVVCAGDTLEFYNVSTVGLKCFQEWNVDGIVFNGREDTVSHVFEQPGIYPIKLYSNCGGQTDTFTVNITVHPKPDPGFTVYSNCLNETTIFTNTSGILSGSISNYLWDFGDNTTSTLNQPTHTYISTGTYNVHLTATSDQGCIHDTVGQVMVHPNPVAAFSHSEACAGGTIEFTDLSATPGGTINQWFWQGNTGEPWQPGASTHSIIYASAGNYTPSLAVENSFGCNDTISDQLTILPKPVANFIVTDECLGSPTRYVNLTSGLIPASALVFDWDLGDGTTYNGFQPLPYTYSNFGLYTVTLSIDDPVRSGCQDDTSFIATVHAIPEPFFLNVPDNCQPYSVTFSDASNVFNNTISRWYWDFGNGESSVKQNPTVVYTNSGTYTISLSVESQAGCPSAAPHIQEIEVYPKPFADFIYDPQMPTILFADISFRERCLGEIEYLWNFGDGSGSTEANPRHLYSDPGEYEVWLEATSDKGCKDTVTKILEVVNDYSLFIPNAFSPNADGKNETFRPEAFNITDYRLEIFDRWGEVLFTTLNLEQGWNGIYGEKECPEAIYVYKLTYKDPFNEVHYKTGWFALIR